MNLRLHSLSGEFTLGYVEITRTNKNSKNGINADCFWTIPWERELLKTVFKILKPIYILRSQNVYKFIAFSKNILNIFLAQILRKLQQLEVLEDLAVLDYLPPLTAFNGVNILIAWKYLLRAFQIYP